MDGDYPSASLQPMARGALKYLITPSLSLSASANVLKLANKGYVNAGYATFDLNAEWMLLPKDRFSPYVFAGGGFGFNKNVENTHLKVQFGAGLEYMVSDNIGIKVYGEQNVNFSDNIDYLERGVRDDYYYRFGLGLTYYFPNRK